MKLVGLVLLALLALGIGRADAKFGETAEQIRARYGEPLSKQNDGALVRVQYHFGEYVVVVSFVNGVSMAESVTPREQGASISETEALALARGISGLKDWKADDGIHGLQMIWYAGTNAVAILDQSHFDDQMLTLVSAQYVAWHARENQALEKKFGEAPGGSKGGTLPYWEFTNDFVAVKTNARSGALNSRMPASNTDLRAAKKTKVEDDARLLKWQLEQAEAGETIYMRKVGLRYLLGDGVSVDLSKAREWLTKATAKGDQEAADALEKLNKPTPASK